MPISRKKMWKNWIKKESIISKITPRLPSPPLDWSSYPQCTTSLQWDPRPLTYLQDYQSGPTMTAFFASEPQKLSGGTSWWQTDQRHEWRDQHDQEEWYIWAHGQTWKQGHHRPQRALQDQVILQLKNTMLDVCQGLFTKTTTWLQWNICSSCMHEDHPDSLAIEV